MPLYEYLCLDCGQQSELLITGSSDEPRCRSCGSSSLKKLLSAHASLSGGRGNSMPCHGDPHCCETSPGEAGCAGPGSCCGKVPH